MQVMKELDADVFTLQEIIEEHAEWLAGELKYDKAFGRARDLQGKPYGNVTLSRWPAESVSEYTRSTPTGTLRGPHAAPTAGA